MVETVLHLTVYINIENVKEVTKGIKIRYGIHVCSYEINYTWRKEISWRASNESER